MNHDFTITLFAIGVVGALILMIVKSFLPTNNNSQKEIELKKKLETQKRELVEFSMNQVFVLNRMATNGAITPAQWVSEFNKIVDTLKCLDIDTSVLSFVPPPTFPNKNEMVLRVLNIANTLDASRAITANEYETHINTALDNYTKK